MRSTLLAMAVATGLTGLSVAGDASAATLVQPVQWSNCGPECQRHREWEHRRWEHERWRESERHRYHNGYSYNYR